MHFGSCLLKMLPGVRREHEKMQANCKRNGNDPLFPWTFLVYPTPLTLQKFASPEIHKDMRTSQQGQTLSLLPWYFHESAIALCLITLNCAQLENLELKSQRNNFQSQK